MVQFRRHIGGFEKDSISCAEEIDDGIVAIPGI